MVASLLDQRSALAIRSHGDAGVEVEFGGTQGGRCDLRVALYRWASRRLTTNSKRGRCKGLILQ